MQYFRELIASGKYRLTLNIHFLKLKIMKTYRRYLIFLLFILSLCPSIVAQIFIDGIGLDRSDIQFCEIIEVDYNSFKKRLSVISQTERSLFVSTNYKMENEARQVFIDFGQLIDWNNQQRFQEPDGNDIQFNSAMQALNYLVKNGWIFHTRTENYNAGVRLTRYLLKRNLDFTLSERAEREIIESVASTMILGENIGFIISKLDGWILPISNSQQKELTLFLDGYQEQTSPAIIEVQVSKMDMELEDFKKANKEAGYQVVDSKDDIEVYEFRQPEENVFTQIAYLLKDDDLFSFQFSTAELEYFEKHKGDFLAILNNLKMRNSKGVFDKN